MERFLGFWDSVSAFALPIAICIVLTLLVLAPFIVPGMEGTPASPHY